jgi:hypothetical protein
MDLIKAPSFNANKACWLSRTIMNIKSSGVCVCVTIFIPGVLYERMRQQLIPRPQLRQLA